MTHYNAIYLSPHLDDAALSCGAQIYQRTCLGQKVLIATVTAGDPAELSLSEYAQSLHDRWALITDAVEGRRQEDRQAAKILGADVQHWSLPDCIYRFDEASGDPYYTSDDEIFGEIHPAEDGLIDELCGLIQGLSGCDELYVPLGVGNHVDHRLTRVAAERAVDRWGGVSKPQISYYEEYPYAQEQPEATSRILAESIYPMHLTTIPISDAGLDARVRSIAKFKSQLSTFWETDRELVAQVTDYVRQVGGERIWRLQ